jgi:hypothetical protein
VDSLGSGGRRGVSGIVDVLGTNTEAPAASSFAFGNTTQQDAILVLLRACLDLDARSPAVTDPGIGVGWGALHG